jgi:elongation factor Ts
MVKTLREQTGVGMMECKKALEEADGDLKRAGELLREKGAAKAVKRAGRATKEGRIAALVSDDKRSGILVEVNSETDFAAKNERFAKLVEIAAQTAMRTGADSVEALLAAKPVGSDLESVQAVVTDCIAVIGENMGVGRLVANRIPGDQTGLVHAYIHPPGKVGVLVQLGCENASVAANPATDELAHELCLQIAFSDPKGIDSSSIPADVIAAEKEVYKAQAIQEGKPANLLDKIVEGKLRGFYKEVCLIEQGYVKEEKKSVSQLIAEVSKQVGGKISVVGFTRLQLGVGGEGEEA